MTLKNVISKEKRMIPACLSVEVIKHWANPTCRRKGVILAYTIKEMRTGTQGRNLEADTGAATTEERYSPCSQSSFLMHPGPPRNGTSNCGPDPPTSISNQKIARQTCVKAKMMEEILQLGSLFPGVSSGQCSLAITGTVLFAHFYQSPHHITQALWHQNGWNYKQSRMKKKI